MKRWTTAQWRRHLEESDAPWYLLADDGGEEPELVERGRTRRFGVRIVNLVALYGEDPGPWIRVGTWDTGYVGPDPGPAARAGRAREGVADRFALYAAEVPENESERDPPAVLRRIDAARPAPTAWRDAELSIDGVAYAAFTTSVGRHEVIYSTAPGRCVFVHACGRPLPRALRSCRDLAVYDALVARSDS